MPMLSQRDNSRMNRTVGQRERGSRLDLGPGDDVSASACRRGEDAVVVREVAAGLRQDGDEAGEELVWGEHDAGSAVVPAALELQEQRSVGLPGEPVVRQRGPLDVATQPFEGLAVVGRDADRGVQVEVPRRRTALGEAANRVLAHPSGDGASTQPKRLASGDRGGGAG
jgi:hypothetical protein